MNVFYEPYRVLERVYQEGAHLKLALAELPEGEHGRTVKIAYGVLEHDGYLNLCIASVACKRPRPALALILKIALYCMLFADMPRPVAVNEAVALTKLLKKEGAAGFINAALRNFDETKVRIPEGLEGLAVRSNFPRFALRELTQKYGARAERIVTAKSAGVSVRFERNMDAYLSLPHLDTPFPSVKIFPHFVRDCAFFEGDYTFQSVGSVAVADVIEPCDLLFDACAAPGGKSVLLAKKCKRVIANELHAHRAALIESYCSRMKATNVKIETGDAACFHEAYEGAFDGVLCDVPCSGLGTVAENPDLPLGKDEGTMSELGALQRAILETCSRYVRPGGHLYYATCSILERENGGVVSAFLESHPAFSPQPCTSPLPHEREGFGLQFLPDVAFGAGFYVAKLRRTQ